MSELETLLDYKFKNTDLLTLALTHKSHFYESKDRPTGHNEKLEFLGDAVLDLVLSELLMAEFPSDEEGSLSKKRASLVNESILAKIAGDMGLATFMILGRGELASGGDRKPRLLASTLEALVGAVFLDGGFDMAREILKRLFVKHIKQIDPTQDFTADFKTRLQEVIQSEFKIAPVYRLVYESGPSHDREFKIEVTHGEEILGKGVGKSKKAAEQEAAHRALDYWQARQDGLLQQLSITNGESK